MKMRSTISELTTAFSATFLILTVVDSNGSEFSNLPCKNPLFSVLPCEMTNFQGWRGRG